MMQKVTFFLTILVFVLMTACNHKPNEPQVPGTPSDKPHWVAVSNPEYQSSMTITCMPPVGEKVSAEDELSVFWGDTCRATASIVDSVFYLGVSGPQSSTSMELRYYSASFKTLRQTSLTYVPDSILGSYDEPYRITFK